MTYIQKNTILWNVHNELLSLYGGGKKEKKNFSAEFSEKKITLNHIKMFSVTLLAGFKGCKFPISLSNMHSLVEIRGNWENVK